jgi:hypothetical protein
VEPDQRRLLVDVADDRIDRRASACSTIESLAGSSSERSSLAATASASVVSASTGVTGAAAGTTGGSTVATERRTTNDQRREREEQQPHRGILPSEIGAGRGFTLRHLRRQKNLVSAGQPSST